MASLLYYLSKREPHSASLAGMQSVGLGHAFDANPAKVRVSKGPDGIGGIVVARELPGCGYYPDKQTWEPMRGLDGVWMGIYNDAKPLPRDLLRDDNIGGWPVKLNDGQKWLVPSVRSFVMQDGQVRYRDNLSRELLYDGATDTFQPGEVVSRLRRLSEIATLWNDHRQEEQRINALIEETTPGEETYVTIPGEAPHWMTDVLQYNYYLGKHETRLLKLFNDDYNFMHTVLMQTLGAGLADDLLKKNALSDASSSIAGDAD